VTGVDELSDPLDSGIFYEPLISTAVHDTSITAQLVASMLFDVTEVAPKFIFESRDVFEVPALTQVEQHQTALGDVLYDFNAIEQCFDNTTPDSSKLSDSPNMRILASQYIDEYNEMCFELEVDDADLNTVENIEQSVLENIPEHLDVDVDTPLEQKSMLFNDGVGSNAEQFLNLGGNAEDDELIDDKQVPSQVSCYPTTHKAYAFSTNPSLNLMCGGINFEID
jgi:hypothetical protein